MKSKKTRPKAGPSAPHDIVRQLTEMEGEVERTARDVRVAKVQLKEAKATFRHARKAAKRARKALKKVAVALRKKAARKPGRGAGGKSKRTRDFRATQLGFRRGAHPTGLPESARSP